MHLSTVGDRQFPVTDADTWNAFSPCHLGMFTVPVFRACLKTLPLLTVLPVTVECQTVALVFVALHLHVDS